MSNLSTLNKTETTPRGKEEQLFAELLSAMDTSNVPEEGSVIDGTVVSITKGEVLIDYGGKAEGVVQGRELEDRSMDKDSLQIGDEVLAIVLLSEDEEGRAVLSIRRARAERKWREMKQKFDNKEAVNVAVVQPNKGGLIVNAEGLQGFVPISQLGPDHYPSSIQKGPGFADAAIAYLTQFIGAEFQAQIIEFERKTNRLILSERLLLQRTQGLKPLEELDFKVGSVVKGKVVAIKDFGVFVDLGTTSGLVHISEISWDRVNHPGDLVKVGQELEVKVIGIEEGGRRVSLSMKKLLDNPWAKVARKYEIGQVVKGTVTKIVDYGAFVQIEAGFDGLVHISELSSFHVKDPADVLQEGQECDFKIILLEIDEQRLGLSYKQANPEPLAQGDLPAESAAIPFTPADVGAMEEPAMEAREGSDAAWDSLAQSKPAEMPAVEPKASEEPSVSEEAPAASESPQVAEEEHISKEDALKKIMELEGVGPAMAEKLYDAGYTTIELLTTATISQLSLIPGIRMATAEKISNAAKQASGSID